MIIRMTLKSNLYSELIEKYFDDGGPFTPKYHRSKKKYEKFMRNVKVINNHDEYRPSEKEGDIRRARNTIIKNFTNYINAISKDSNFQTKRFNAERVNTYKDFIFRNLDVKVVELMIDKSFNKEVVFYIDRVDKYITL